MGRDAKCPCAWEARYTCARVGGEGKCSGKRKESISCCFLWAIEIAHASATKDGLNDGPHMLVANGGDGLKV